MKLQTPTSMLQGSTRPQNEPEHDAEREGETIFPSYPEPEEWIRMLSDGPLGRDPRHPFDLEERTARFGEAIVRFSKRIPRDPTNNRLIDQLVGCGTSVGGNYCEASESVSKKDFHFIVGRCKKEAKETKFFLRMVVASEPDLAEEARIHFREATELHLIFSAIFRNSA